MGRRARILTEILGFDGWKVIEADSESARGVCIQPIGSLAVVRDTRLVLVVERRLYCCFGGLHSTAGEGLRPFAPPW